MNPQRDLSSVVDEYLSHQPFPLAMLRPFEASFYPKKLPAPSLDVGSGDGFFARAVFGTRRIMVGIDPDAKVLTRADASRAYQKTLRFDGIHTPFPSSTFRSVIANCVLEHVDDPSGLLAEIGRVTGPGGMFSFTTPTVHFDRMLLGSRILHASHLTLFAHLYERFMDWVTRQKYYWTKERWVNELKKNGFRLVMHQEFFGPRALAVFDIAHWLSIPSIGTKLLTGRWIAFPELRLKLHVLKKLRDWSFEGPETPGAFQFFTFRKVFRKTRS